MLIFFLAYVKPSENASFLFCHPFLFCPSLCLHAMGLSDDELPSNGSTSDSDAKTLVSKRTNTSKSSTHRAKTQKKVKKDAKPRPSLKQSMKTRGAPSCVAISSVRPRLCIASTTPEMSQP